MPRRLQLLLEFSISFRICGSGAVFKLPPQIFQPIFQLLYSHRTKIQVFAQFRHFFLILGNKLVILPDCILQVFILGAISFALGFK
ncbi:MAG: hypothetical protein K2F74_03740, partial [Muribaculaceae bacterium]|nr:hypothetical protein [Muribaculaceae bacterium]